MRDMSALLEELKKQTLARILIGGLDPSNDSSVN
jgi:hypothetical protein